MNELKIIDIECTDNRKMSGIEELAENIAAVGLIQPIALKDEGNGRYRVVAGRRRFRALQRLGWEKLQGSQYVICDADPELAAFCENFHRANLTLAEEVGQFHQLKADKLTIRELASLLGKSPDYVALRLNLTNLSASWQKVLSHPEDYPQWTPAKLELIARQTEEIQEDRAYWRDRTMSVKEINEALAGDNAFLKSAPFDTTACRECPKRSGAAELLFPDLAGKGDTCLDRKCFEEKLLKCVWRRSNQSANGLRLIRMPSRFICFLTICRGEQKRISSSINLAVQCILLLKRREKRITTPIACGDQGRGLIFA